MRIALIHDGMELNLMHEVCLKRGQIRVLGWVELEEEGASWLCGGCFGPVGEQPASLPTEANGAPKMDDQER